MAIQSRMLISIDNPSDSRLHAYRDIRERDMVGREGRFIAEGKVVISVLLNAQRFETESILVSENRLAGISALLEGAPATLPVYVASEDVLSQIAGFHVHRGVLAIGKARAQPALDSFVGTLGPDALVVVLSDISNHDNVGSIFRNAAAFEADAVILDETCCDPLYRKSVRVSVGAALKVPFFRGGALSAILAALESQGFGVAALSPQGQKPVSSMKFGGRRALLLGSEGHGLPVSIMQRLETWAIPMSSTFDSLNVATASGIALFHASKFGKS